MKWILLGVAVIVGTGFAAFAQLERREEALRLELEDAIEGNEKIENQIAALEKEVESRAPGAAEVEVKQEKLRSVKIQTEQYLELLPHLLRDFSEMQYLSNAYQDAFTANSELTPGQTFELVELKTGESFNSVTIRDIHDGKAAFSHETGATRRPLEEFPDELLGKQVKRPPLNGHYLKDFAGFVNEIPDLLMKGAFAEEVQHFRRDQLKQKLEKEARELSLAAREKARKDLAMRYQYAKAQATATAKPKQGKRSMIAEETLKMTRIMSLNRQIDQLNYAIQVSFSRYNSKKIRPDRRAFLRTIDEKLAQIRTLQRMVAQLGGTPYHAIELPTIQRPVRAVRVSSGSS